MGSLSDEPVAIGVPIAPSDVRIYTYRSEDSSRYRDLLDFVSNVKLVFTKAWFICCIVLIVVLATMLYAEKFRLWPFWRRRKRLRIRWRSYWQQLFKCTWHVSNVITDQEGLRVTTAASRTLWLFYCVATFVVVFGYALNFISADLVTLEESPRIDTVQQLLDIGNIYSRAKMYAFKNLFLYNHLRSTPEDSLEHQLLLFFNENSTFDGGYHGRWATLDGGPKLMRLFLEMTESRKARDGSGMVTEEFFCALLRHPMCRIDPSFQTLRTESREVVAQGVISTIFNRRTNKMLKKYADYFFLTQLEMASLDKVIAALVEVIAIPTGSSPLKIYQCVIGYKEKQELTFKPVKLKLLEKTLHVTAWCVVAAVIALLAELLLHQCHLWISDV